MSVLSYRILLRKEPEGGYTVIVPSLPGCVTYGDTNRQRNFRIHINSRG